MRYIWLLIPLLLTSCATRDAAYWRQWCNEQATVYKDDPGYLDFCVEAAMYTMNNPTRNRSGTDDEDVLTLKDGDTIKKDGKRYKVRRNGNTLKIDGKKYRVDKRNGTITIKQ